jgi:hypothetical protein
MQHHTAVHATGAAPARCRALTRRAAFYTCGEMHTYKCWPHLTWHAASERACNRSSLGTLPAPGDGTAHQVMHAAKCTQNKRWPHLTWHAASERASERPCNRPQSSHLSRVRVGWLVSNPVACLLISQDPIDVSSPGHALEATLHVRCLMGPDRPHSQLAVAAVACCRKDSALRRLQPA